MAHNIAILRQRTDGIGTMQPTRELALPDLTRRATTAERAVLAHIAARDGNAENLTVEELTAFNREVIEAAAGNDDAKLSSDEWAAMQQRTGLVQVDAKNALDAAFLATMKADAMRAESVDSVRNVSWSAWNDQRTTRCAYFAAEDMVKYGRGDKAVLDRFLDSLDGTDINGVVVDVKEGGGAVYFRAYSNSQTPDDWSLEHVVRRARIGRAADLGEIVDKIHRRGMKAIARQVVFKDSRLVSVHPEAAIQTYSGRPWGNSKMWVNPWHPDARAYNIELAKRALASGADEIQFDYIRFPDQGQGSRASARYPERPSGQHYCDAITGFLREAHREIKEDFPNAKIGADVFGYVAAGRNIRDALGQDVGAMSRYLDVIWPMQYPSHWASRGNRVFGTYHPETRPSTVYSSTTRGLIRQIPSWRRDKVEVRPWLQAFTLPWFGGVRMEEPSYGQLGDYVDEQVRGLRSGDANGYALWGPSFSQRSVFYHQRRDNQS